MAIPSQHIAAAFDRAAHRWPDVTLDRHTFAEYVAHLAINSEVLDAHAEDLFLVAGCLVGHPRALAHLDAVYLSRVSHYVGRIGRTSDFHEDVAQQLREKLLTSTSPKLASYAGRGPLADWIRAATVRTALNLARPDRRNVLAGLPAELLRTGDCWDARTLDLRHRADFQRALEAAFAALAPRERTLVRLHFADRVGIDRLGLMYGVHRATIARRIVRLRRQMFEHVASCLGTQLGWNESTVHSVYRIFSGDLHLSITRLLRSDAA
jgi:RNA polymerase sigma-70 factor, ECF subfamily